MVFLDTLPVWVVGIAIFFLRIGDVSLGTIRTIAVIQGRKPGIIADAKDVDPDMFYTVESAASWSENVQPLAADGGWRAFMKRK